MASCGIFNGAFYSMPSLCLLRGMPTEGVPLCPVDPLLPPDSAALAAN